MGVIRAALLLLSLQAAALVVNTEVKRTFDLTRHIVRQVDDISFRDEDGPVASYTVAIPLVFYERLSYISVKTDKNAACDVVRGSRAGDTQLFNVQLPSPVLKGVDGSIKVTAYFTRILTPLPAAIKQNENQLVVFRAPHLLPSPYATLTQTTRVKLPSSHIESHTPLPPVTASGSMLTYGPYTSTPADAPSSINTPFNVHFLHNEPFLTMTSLVKEIEVSMWGRVSTEEVVDVEHTGAALVGGFSRFEYSENHAVSASFRSFVAVLPKHSTNIYYRDQIGNITTSRLTPHATSGRTELELLARYPLFGGWRTQFYLGYSVPTTSVLYHTNDQYRLEGDLSTSVQHAAVDEVTVKVILPEGATNIQVAVPFAAEISHTTRQSFLDTPDVGRPVVIVKLSNVVPAHNDAPFTVTFDYPSHYIYREPALVVAAIFAFFVVCMGVVRVTPSSIKGHDEAPIKRD